jgi:hypothetical protein
MEEIINKEIAEKLMQIKGQVRGIALKSHQEFIIKEKGKEGLRKLENEMANLEYPIKYEEIKPLDFYPLGLEAIALLAIKKLFNFDSRKFEEIGIFQTKISFILKLFMKYFGSIGLIVEKGPEIWRRYYDVGTLKVVESDEKEKRAIIRIENFNVHKLHCHHVKGYIENVVRMTVNRPVSCEEKKCTFSGDDYHEFIVEW